MELKLNSVQFETCHEDDGEVLHWNRFYWMKICNREGNCDFFQFQGARVQQINLKLWQKLIKNLKISWRNFLTSFKRILICQECTFYWIPEFLSPFLKSELKNRTNENFFLQKKSFPSDIYCFKIFPKKFPEQNFIQINLISNQIKKSPRKNFLFRFYIIQIAYFFHLNRTLFLSSYSAFDQSSFMYFAMDYLIFKDLLAYFEFQQFWGIFMSKWIEIEYSKSKSIEISVLHVSAQLKFLKFPHPKRNLFKWIPQYKQTNTVSTSQKKKLLIL